MIAFICSMTDDLSKQEFIIWLYENYQRLMYTTARKLVSDSESCKDII